MRYPPSRLLAAPRASSAGGILRAAVTGLIFTTCLTLALVYLGVPRDGQTPGGGAQNR